MGSFPFPRNADVKLSKSTFVARVTGGAQSDAALFAALARTLRFPDYFGRNWAALDECLGDLSWLPRDVALLHDGTPGLSRKELAIYLEILRDAQVVAAEEGRILTVAFAEQTRALNEAWSKVKS
ncbi:MAG TPA: barstar family protein [Terricaulis sp.]|nr:barstar family protein [Terricaulis sp.]